MNNKHKHFDLIVQWAAGATIQYSYNGIDNWCTATNDRAPEWLENTFYRVKPEPKEDIVLYGQIDVNINDTALSFDLSSYFSKKKNHYDNVKLVYSGDTLKLKSIEMIENGS